MTVCSPQNYICRDPRPLRILFYILSKFSFCKSALFIYSVNSVFIVSEKSVFKSPRRILLSFREYFIYLWALWWFFSFGFLSAPPRGFLFAVRFLFGNYVRKTPLFIGVAKFAFLYTRKIQFLLSVFPRAPAELIKGVSSAGSFFIGLQNSVFNRSLFFIGSLNSFFNIKFFFMSPKTLKIIPLPFVLPPWLLVPGVRAPIEKYMLFDFCPDFCPVLCCMPNLPIYRYLLDFCPFCPFFPAVLRAWDPAPLLIFLKCCKLLQVNF